jgi:uncharacterized protein YqeY
LTRPANRAPGNGRPVAAVKIESEARMSIQAKLKEDLSAAIKTRDEIRKDVLRVVLGEFGRQERKQLSDAEVIRILKKLVKSEREVLDRKGTAEDSAFITILESYLPQMASDEEIVSWARQNIDFTQLKNRMQAVGAIMKHFGPRADGSRVKDLLQRM